jgi:hypothetical protein
VEHQVAVPVADRGADQAEVGGQRGLQHVLPAVELADLLGGGRLHDVAVGVVVHRDAAVGDHRAHPGGGVEGGDAGAAGAQPLGQRALRGQLHRQLAGQVERASSLLPPTNELIVR